MRPTITSTEDLVARCRQGDQRAQLAIYQRYYKAMYNTSLRIVRDPTEAEDLMQEAFLKAFTRIDSYREEASFGAWLKKIVVNFSLSALKKGSRLILSEYNDQLNDGPEDHQGIDQEESFQNREVQRLIRTLDSLKENDRLILNLHLIEGYDHQEICQIMNLSYANCRTTISRAKKRLRKKLQQHEK